MSKRSTNSAENRQLNLLAEAVQLEAAAGDSQPQSLRRLSMTAYTGGPMQLAGWRYPVVVDLAGLVVGRQRRPILLGHSQDVESVLGQTDSVSVVNHQLLVAGQVMGESPKAAQVIALNDRGFAWQASIGARADQVEFVAEGKTSVVNGREVAGPVNIARRATLGEVSFVVLGADDNTSAQIAAGAATSQENQDMEFAQWVEAQGFTIDALSEQQATALRAMHAAQTPQPKEGEPPAADPVKDLRAAAAGEVKRIAAVRKACNGKHPDIEAKAIEEGWDGNRTELEVLRASRPQGPAIHSHNRVPNGKAIEAALCLSAKMPEAKVATWYDSQTMEAAHTRDLRGMGLQHLLHYVVQAAGSYVRPGPLSDDAIRTAFEADQSLRAAANGYSTISLSGILSNVANKALLEAYTAVNGVSAQICGQSDVADFKQVTRYRMTGLGTFEKVGPDGELKHAKLTEESYTNQVDTYGKIISLTRQMIYNDELGAFLQIPRMLGRQSALAVESAVFTVLLSNPSNFFSVAHKNYFEGADTTLQISSLTTAERMFEEQTDAGGKPILIRPRFLLVPTSLKVTAQQLMTETRVNETTTTDKPKPASNPHAGKWEPIATPYLNSQGISGSSATGWYLLADPNDVAAIEIAYLRGMRTPTIESGETDFDNLGMKWRGYFDFGVNVQDYRAAVRSKGAA